MVPVIRNAQSKNLWQLANEISRLADAARNGTAKKEEMEGGTLTVTSLGPLGGGRVEAAASSGLAVARWLERLPA